MACKEGLLSYPSCSLVHSVIHLAWVVGKVNCAIQWISVNKTNPARYPLDSDLSGRQCLPPLEQPENNCYLQTVTRTSCSLGMIGGSCCRSAFRRNTMQQTVKWKAVALSMPGFIPGMTALKNSAALVIRILVTRSWMVNEFNYKL